MADKFTVNLQGIKELRSKIKELKAIPGKIQTLVEATANDTNDDAISNIQANGSIDLGAGGGLLSHQYVIPINDYTFKVGNSAKWAPFIEWGTGQQVDVSAEAQEYASQFKGPYPGTWDEFEQNIKAWLTRHGKPEKAAFPVMLKILEKGLPAKPFLWPAYQKNKAKLIDSVKQLLKK